MDNNKSPIFAQVSPLLGQPNEYASQTGFDIMPTNETIALMGRDVCLQQSEDKQICDNLAFLFTGYYTKNIVQDNIPLYMSFLPNGSSARQLLHFAQVYNSKKFQKFDFGEEQNMELYGTVSPPDYPLHKITIPTYFYYSHNDILVDPIDVKRCARAMNPWAVRGEFKVPLETFTHMDFIWANRQAKTYLYGKLFRDLKGWWF